MERITRQVVQYISDMEKKAKQMNFVKNLKKSVEHGKHGTQKYVIKHVKTKGKFYDRVSGSFTYDCTGRDQGSPYPDLNV